LPVRFEEDPVEDEDEDEAGASVGGVSFVTSRKDVVPEGGSMALEEDDDDEDDDDIAGKDFFDKLGSSGKKR